MNKKNKKQDEPDSTMGGLRFVILTVSNHQIISPVYQESVDGKLSPQDLNNESMATVGGVGDVREQIYKSWALPGVGKQE